LQLLPQDPFVNAPFQIVQLEEQIIWAQQFSRLKKFGIKLKQGGKG
jgi:hypothetical protein